MLAYLTNHKAKSLLPAVALTVVLLNGSAKLGVLPSSILLVLKRIENKSISYSLAKGLGSRRGEIGPAIEMHTDLKYVYMFYFIEKNRNFICLVLKL